MQQLGHWLDLESVRIDVSAKSKRVLLQQLGSIAAGRLALPGEAVQSCLAERERLGTTGLGGGVAVPHGKIAGVRGVFVTVARLIRPLDYEAVDGQPVDLVFLLLSQPDAGVEHLKALAAVSRFVRQPATIQKLRGARTRDAFAAVLTGADERDAA